MPDRFRPDGFAGALSKIILKDDCGARSGLQSAVPSRGKHSVVFALAGHAIARPGVL